ncbi:hypothetical protein VTL71DRAFT_14864 [Oculimacula yallundae]|uniref:C2H2-type domain-containing protein n=1 Tax=Oculimacula yallundae TaxID=86028 RepID=A0ABR4CEZ3_9HELO
MAKCWMCGMEFANDNAGGYALIAHFAAQHAEIAEAAEKTCPHIGCGVTKANMPELNWHIERRGEETRG